MGLQPLNVLAVSVVVILFCSTVDGQAPIVSCSKSQDASPDFTWLKLKALESVISYTTWNNYNYYVYSRSTERRCYARGMCRLSEVKYPGACSECLRGAQVLMANDCGPIVVGAHVNIGICQMKFENYVFSDG